MNKIYFDDKEFQKVDFNIERIVLGDYNHCIFIDCDFSNTNLSDINFEECQFENCDFSNVKIRNAAIQYATFKNCKLLGVHFDECNRFLLSFYFKNCQLNLASFYQLKIKGTKFKDCILQEVDFTETDLTGSVFENCDFSGSMFGNTILDKADFRSSFNFSINPETNRIKKARFSIQGIAGLLDKYDIKIESTPIS